MPYPIPTDTYTFAALAYSVAAFAQLIASVVALNQIKKFTSHRAGWILLSLGLALMLSRRIVPLYLLFNKNQYSIADANLALIISLLLMFGVFKVRRLFDYLQQQEQRLEQIAKYDFLTGALSRYAIMDQGQLEVERSLRNKRPISIVLIDIDRFKEINDDFGHAAGDEVLVNMVRICKQVLRQIDLFGRLGGDEFLVILPETDLDEANEIVSRLKSEISSADFKYQSNQFKISISLGVACSELNNNSINVAFNAKDKLDNLIHEADLKMYQNKTI